MPEQVEDFKPGWWLNGKMNYFNTKGSIGMSERDAIRFPSLEEAWEFLEAREPLTEKCCVKLPTGKYAFSGVNDRLFNQRRDLYGDKVRFIRATKSYMLKFD